jgi:hypothetical protein
VNQRARQQRNGNGTSDTMIAFQNRGTALHYCPTINGIRYTPMAGLQFANFGR